MKGVVAGLKEPLIQFLVLALGLFVIDQWIGNKEDNKKIEWSISEKQRFTERFEQRAGRPPTQKEFKQFEANWIKEEILFQEGLALNFAEHDPIIRQRVIDKMRTLLTLKEGQLEPSPENLMTFLRENKERYWQAETMSFDIVRWPDSEQPDFLEKDQYGELIVQAATQDSEGPLSRYYWTEDERSEAFVQARYGEGLWSRLKSATAGQWYWGNVPGGYEGIRLRIYRPPQLPEFESIKSQLTLDWRKYQESLRIEEALAALQQRYDVVSPSQ